MNRFIRGCAFTLTMFAGTSLLAQGRVVLAPVPPMGWNSWDSYGLTITEEQFTANVEWFSGVGQALSRAHLSAYLCEGTLILHSHPLMSAADVPIRGRHNLENVLAASIAAAAARLSHEAIAAGVRTFRAVEHRLEFVRNVSGVDFYNDSKATSVDATLKAVDAFPGNLWVILGGKYKGLDYSALREPLAAKAHAALLIGAANRDPGRYPDPDAFDIFRADKQHVSFGDGAHKCLGMHLARLEMRILLNAVLDRLPGLRLDPAADAPHIHGLLFRSPPNLPVRFDPPEPALARGRGPVSRAG